MPETARNSLFQPVILAVDASGYTLANIELAVKMATAFNVQLQGLFIEDTDLLQIADLPFSTEITLSTGQERRLDVLSLQRSLRTKSVEFRNKLEVTAEKSQVKWSFDSVRGRKMETTLSGIEGSGIMIIGHALSGMRSLTRRVGKKRILLFDEDLNNLQDVLEIMLNFSAASGVELTLVETDKNSRLAFLQELESKQIGGLDLSYLDENEFQKLMKEKKLAPDYVIASRHQNSNILRWMMENSICPVILSGA